MTDLVFGKRYKVDDPEIKYIIDFNGLVFSGLAACDVVNIYPWLSVFPLQGIFNLKKGLKMRNQFYRKEYLTHVENYDPSHLRDVFDSVIKVLREDETAVKAETDVNTMDNIEMLVSDIYVGGTEITVSTLQWAVIYFLHWPHILDRCYAEIIEVCGTERYPEISDRISLHYFHATIYEILRFSSIGPFGFPRATMRDTNVEGLNIPKATQVIVNIWAIHNDQKEWNDPEAFNPERFLDENGKFASGMNESFFGFGAGKRQCFGEAVAKMELFIILSRLVRDFTMSTVPGDPLPSMEGVLGITNAPKNHNVIFRSREVNNN